MMKHRNHFQNVPDLKWQDNKIKEMVNYCKGKNIKILPVVPIIHKDVIDLSQRFKDDRFMPSMIAIFGCINDYWYVNDFTKDPDNFGDPFHTYRHQVYINTIWGNNKTFFRVVR